MVPFAFPPPPPPPPPKAQASQGDAASPYVSNAGPWRGRGRGRGRGSHIGARSRNQNGADRGKLSLQTAGSHPSQELNHVAQRQHGDVNGHDRNTRQNFMSSITNLYQQSLGAAPSPNWTYGGFQHGGPSTDHTGRLAMQMMQYSSSMPQQVSCGTAGNKQDQVVSVSRSPTAETSSTGYVGNARGRKRTFEAHSESGNAYPGSHDQSSSFNHYVRSSKAKRSQPGNATASASLQPVSTRPRVETAPSVPSFGASIPVFVPAESSITPVRANGGNERNPGGNAKRKRTTNQLGLTPQGDTHEDSDDDADEESKLTFTIPRASDIQFDFKGVTTSLGSAAELAAWIAERKKRFPTKARVEAKKLEEKKRLQERVEARKRLNDTRKHEKQLKQRILNTKVSKPLDTLRSPARQDDLDRNQRKWEKEKKTKGALEKCLAKVDRLKKRLQNAEQENKKTTAVRSAEHGETDEANSSLKNKLDDSILALRKTDGGLSTVQNGLREVEIHTLLANNKVAKNDAGIAKGEIQSFPSRSVKNQDMELTVASHPEIDEDESSNHTSILPVSLAASKTPGLANNENGTQIMHTIEQTKSTPYIAEVPPTNIPAEESVTSLSSDNISSTDSEVSSDDSSSDDSSLDDSSSSDSSSDSDQSLSTISAKMSTPRAVATQDSKDGGAAESPAKKHCGFFAKHGRCKYGAKCLYSHASRLESVSETARGKRNKGQKDGAADGKKEKRKSLFQRLVEGEQRQEAKRLLEAIKVLGDAGWLE